MLLVVNKNIWLLYLCAKVRILSQMNKETLADVAIVREFFRNFGT